MTDTEFAKFEEDVKTKLNKELDLENVRLEKAGEIKLMYWIIMKLKD